MKHLILVTGIDGNHTSIQFKDKNISILLNDSKFIIPKILCFPYMHGNFLLENKFIYKYLPMQIQEKTILLSINNVLIHIPLLEQHKYI